MSSRLFKTKDISLGAADPMETANPVISRARLVMEDDEVLTEFVTKRTVLAAKLTALRGVREVEREELVFVYAADLLVACTIDQKRCQTVRNDALRWLQPSVIPPYSHDFTAKEIDSVEGGLMASPFLGIAYESLPLPEGRERLTLDGTAITAIRGQLADRR